MWTLDDFDALEDAIKEQEKLVAKINKLYDSVKNKVILEILSYKDESISNIEPLNPSELLANSCSFEYYNINNQLYRISKSLERCRDIESLKRAINVCIYKEQVDDESFTIDLNPKVIEILKKIQEKLSVF